MTTIGSRNTVVKEVVKRVTSDLVTFFGTVINNVDVIMEIMLMGIMLFDFPR